MTEQEKAVIKATIALWNAFCALPVEHPDDAPEVRSAIHLIQDKVLSRPARREWNKEVG
ncbi:hypothetical protein [Pleomorphomonas sp. PLEO]|uniref:hypothetical protein n=1 Tax=Pleomorphomonas sp. PLEO TaxID=3239306 RepID=UPI00351E46F6